jgi:hypothetical protein
METGWYNAQPDGLVYAGLVAYKYKGEMPADYEIEWKEGTSGVADDAFNGCSRLDSVIIPDGVQNIGDRAFKGCNLSSITLPSSLNRIGSFAFQGSQANVYVQWASPIQLDPSVFTDNDSISLRGSMTLYVPTGTLAAYKDAQYWKDFGKIVEYSETDGIEDVTADCASGTTAGNGVYAIDGRRVPSGKLPKGLYVAGGKKELVR